MKDTPYRLYERTDHVRGYALVYFCVRCAKEQVAFLVEIDSQYAKPGDLNYAVRKQGQSPAWSIEPSKEVAKALPPLALQFYRKGLVCLSQNFGLGAVGYFRRVVEQVTDSLIGLVEEHARALGDTTTVEAIGTARHSHQATERLKYAASQLPSHLRLGGRNPLADLYDKYSEGIHSLSDEECVEVAADLRAGLDFLLPALHEHLEAARKYEAAMSKTKRK